MHHFFEPDISRGTSFLSEEESKHAMKVLRIKEGDHIEVLDGKGSLYLCRVNKTGKLCGFETIGKTTIPKKPYTIHIAIAPTKNQERMEWFIEKATEIGIDQVSFIITKNTEKSRLKMDRIWKKAIGAMKQSMSLWLPEINEQTLFIDFLNKSAKGPNKYIAFVDENHQHHLKDVAPKEQPVLVLIGPEGDFTKEEIKAAIGSGFIPVSLGKNRLRTETAGIVACHALNLIQ